MADGDYALKATVSRSFLAGRRDSLGEEVARYYS